MEDEGLMTYTLQDYLVGGILLSLVICGGVVMLTNLTRAPDYDRNQIEQFNDTFNVYADMENQTAQLDNSVKEGDTDFSGGGLNALIISAWNTMRLFSTNFNFLADIFRGINHIFPFIPVWVGGGLVMLVIVLIVFAIWRAIFQAQL